METEVKSSLIATHLHQISQTLKVSEALKCTLIPADDNYLDKKGFTWELVNYQGDKLGLYFEFENPEFISVGREPDTMRLEFVKADVYLPVENEEWYTMPSEFTLTFKIPPQGNGLLSEKEVK